MFLRDYWYAAAWADEVGSSQPGTPPGGGLLRRVILDEPIVFFRKEDGAPVALEDRCAHRRLPLSMGTLQGNQLQCLYHGLVYDCTGRCVHVPGQKDIPEGLGVKSYPVIERHRFIWVWMGDSALADEYKIPNFHLMEDPAWCRAGGRYHVPATYLHIIDNLSDLSHVAYLHSRYTGNEPVGELAELTLDQSLEAGKEAVRGSRWTLDAEPAQTYATFGRYEKGAKVDRFQRYEFKPPGFFSIYNGSAISGTGLSESNLEGGEGRWGFNVYHAITPETEKSTHWFWTAMHEVGAHTPAVCVPLHAQFHQIVAEDLEVFVEQQKNIDIKPVAPTHAINADQGLVLARSLISRLLKLEQQERAKAA